MNVRLMGIRQKLVVPAAIVFLHGFVGPLHAQESEVRAAFGVSARMRDGVNLSADIWFPTDGDSHPTILVRTPYMKTMRAGDFNFPDMAEYFAERGYAVAIQDVRGRGDSDGEFGFFFADAADGYDTVEWIASQPWSNGRVCMMGVSYLGTVQWLAARERPPHLVCIAPTAPAGRYIDELPYQGGAFMMQWALSWINDTSGRIPQENTTSLDWDRVFEHRPLLTMDEVMGRQMPLYREFLEHATMDNYWSRIQFTPDDFRQLDIAALHITGWFDGDQPGAMYYWYGMAEHSPARDEQFLLVGPWDHGQTFLGGALRIGDMKLTGESVIDMRELHLAFFDRYLKETDASFNQPRARVFVTGSNTWRDFDVYPPPMAQERRLYFDSGGRANSLVGDGQLAWEPPTADRHDTFTFDPRNPVPSDIGGEYLAIDRRPIERRDDVLVYTSEELEEAIEIVGRVTVELHAATDVRDTDFTAHLIDVYPDGRAIKLGPTAAGIIRARYRHGLDRTELLTPGQTEKYEINLRDIGHTFLPGHRIRIEISSSAFPAFNPNQNTGNPVATDVEWRIANQTIYHGPDLLSAVVLPVIPKELVP